MSSVPTGIVPFFKMVSDVESISFVVLASKEEGRTKDGKPYYRATFADSNRQIVCPIWSNTHYFQECRDEWTVGKFYKIRAIYRETNYGPKLEIKKIREVNLSDCQAGFDPNQCRPTSRIAPEILRDELLTLAKVHIGKGPLLMLVQKIFKEYHNRILETAASGYHHHVHVGGLLEHLLSVTRIAILLVDHYRSFYPEIKNRISKPLVVAGAILHDIGKIFEMENTGGRHQHTLEGDLIGHFILGRDLVHYFGPLMGVDPKTQLQLEHIIIAHSNSDWGAPKNPMSLEALIVYHADYSEAMFTTAVKIIMADDSRADLTHRKGPLGTPLLINIMDTQ